MAFRTASTRVLTLILRKILLVWLFTVKAHQRHFFQLVQIAVDLGDHRGHACGFGKCFQNLIEFFLFDQV